MNSKAASILFIGIMFAAFMGILAFMIHAAVEYMKFEPFAGEDAQQLSEMQTISYKQLFFLEKTGSLVLTNIMSKKIIVSGVQMDGEYIIVRNTTDDIFDEYVLALKKSITLNFNEGLQQYLIPYSQEAIQKFWTDDDAGLLPRKLSYELYFNSSDYIYAFSTQQIAIRKQYGEYYFWPHLTLRSNVSFEDIAKNPIIPITLEVTSILSNTTNITFDMDAYVERYLNDIAESNSSSNLSYLITDEILHVYLDDTQKFAALFNMSDYGNVSVMNPQSPEEVVQ